MKNSKKNLKKDKNILYTGCGDKGTTTLFDCKQGRISKSSILVEALGSVDELNAYLGIVKVHSDIDKIAITPHNFLSKAVKEKKKKILYSKILENVQQNLFIIQAELGGAKMSIDQKELQKIESIINQIGEILPPITNFTISGGSIVSASLDFARTLARKTERRIISVSDEAKSIKPRSSDTSKEVSKESRIIGNGTISYMNRLSSLLFAMSRYSNYFFSITENHPNYNKK